MRTSATLLLFVTSFGVTNASGHNLPERRALVLSFETGVSTMLIHEWSSPQSLKKVRGLFDRNGNGRLEKNEQRAARGFLVKRATDGIEISPNLEPEVRIKDDGRKGIRIALLYPEAKAYRLTLSPETVPAELSVVGDGVYTIDAVPKNAESAELRGGQNLIATSNH